MPIHIHIPHCYLERLLFRLIKVNIDEMHIYSDREVRRMVYIERGTKGGGETV